MTIHTIVKKHNKNPSIIHLLDTITKWIPHYSLWMPTLWKTDLMLLTQISPKLADLSILFILYLPNHCRSDEEQITWTNKLSSRKMISAILNYLYLMQLECLHTSVGLVVESVKFMTQDDISSYIQLPLKLIWGFIKLTPIVTGIFHVVSSISLWFSI